MAQWVENLSAAARIAAEARVQSPAQEIPYAAVMAINKYINKQITIRHKKE